MVIITAVDEKNGMMFNNRRQSQDRALRERVYALVGEGRLWMDAYTAKQFKDAPAGTELQVDEAFLDKAGPGDYCFVEDKAVAPYEGKIQKVILFQWNRSYPGDRHLDLDLSSWTLLSQEGFPGSSHDEITMEVYGHGA